jgi:hypothetical protein
MPLSAAAFASFDTLLLAVGEGLEFALQVGGDCAHEDWTTHRPNSAPPIFMIRLNGINTSPWLVHFVLLQ